MINLNYMIYHNPSLRVACKRCQTNQCLNKSGNGYIIDSLGNVYAVAHDKVVDGVRGVGIDTMSGEPTIMDSAIVRLSLSPWFRDRPFTDVLQPRELDLDDPMVRPNLVGVVVPHLRRNCSCRLVVGAR